MNEKQEQQSPESEKTGKCKDITLKIVFGGLIVVIIGIAISAGLGDLVTDIIIITISGALAILDKGTDTKNEIWQGFCWLVCLGGIVDFFSVIGLGRILFLIGYIIASVIAVFCAQKYDEKMYYKQACADIRNQNNNI